MIFECESHIDNLKRFQTITNRYVNYRDIDDTYNEIVYDLLAHIEDEIELFLNSVHELSTVSDDDFEEDLSDFIDGNHESIESFFKSVEETEEFSLNGLHYYMKLFRHSNSVINLYLPE